MPDVYNEIFQYAKTYISDNSQYSPKIVKNTPPDKKFPLVIIRQSRDDLYNENLDKTDQRFRISFSIEIYAVNKDKIAKQTIIYELTKLVNDVFDEHYGLTRRTNREIPNIDIDVCRWNMRFDGKIDENKKIYRR